MRNAEAESNNSVGPVLNAGELADAIVLAIRQVHSNAIVVDRGSYLRVLVPERCRLDRDVLEKILGRSFRLPGDMELCMPSFKGKMIIHADEVVWTWGES